MSFPDGYNGFFVVCSGFFCTALFSYTPFSLSPFPYMIPRHKKKGKKQHIFFLSCLWFGTVRLFKSESTSPPTRFTHCGSFRHDALIGFVGTTFTEPARLKHSQCTGKNKITWNKRVLIRSAHLFHSSQEPEANRKKKKISQTFFCFIQAAGKLRIRDDVKNKIRGGENPLP